MHALVEKFLAKQRPDQGWVSKESACGEFVPAPDLQAGDQVQGFLEGERLGTAFLEALNSYYVEPDLLSNIIFPGGLADLDPVSRAKLRGICRCVQKRLEKCLLHQAGR